MRFKKGFFLLIFLAFSMSCSSNLANQEISSPPSPAVACEKFAGEWYAQYFFKGEDESQIICDNKPCREIENNGVSFNLVCQDGKMKGERVSRHESHSDVNTEIFKTPTPQVSKIITPLKDTKIEKDSLFLSYLDYQGCLVEISVSPKGEFLLGKFVNKDCKSQTVFDRTGSILFVNQTSKSAF